MKNPDMLPWGTKITNIFWFDLRNLAIRGKNQLVVFFLDDDTTTTMFRHYSTSARYNFTYIHNLKDFFFYVGLNLSFNRTMTTPDVELTRIQFLL